MFGLLDKLLGNNADLGEVVSRGAIVLDVRSKGEYQSGHGKPSKNIPLDQIESNIAKIKGWDKPIITCCASGMRSGSAASILKNHGIEAYNGGPWQKANQVIKG